MENRGDDMRRGNKLLVLVLLILMLGITSIYADSADSGWKGYGLYNLSKSGITVTNEIDTVKIAGSNVEAVYEYTIRNDSGREIVASLGIPDNGLNKFSIYDGSKYLKYWKTNVGYVKDNFGLDNLQDKKNGWYIFNMVFSTGQSRTIKISISAEMKMAENDTYDIGIFKDRSYPYTILSERTSYILTFDNFRPYNIVNVEGLQPEQISNEGEVSLSHEGNYGGGGLITYQPIDKMAADKLGASSYKKPKTIVRAFEAGNYRDVVNYCNEYIEAPADKNLTIEQVEYIRAESLRLLGMKDEYLQALNDIDTAKLYPGRIRYKLLVDKLELYDSQSNNEEINKILSEMIPETRDSYPYMFYWLESNGYKLEEEPKDPGLTTHTEKTGELTNKRSFNIPGIILKLFNSARKSWISYLVIGFIIGFIVGRISKKSNRRRRSIYMYRN